MSVDPVAKNLEVYERLDLSFPILSDEGREAIRAFGIVHHGGGMGGEDISRPATFLIDENGVIRWRNLTENWRVRVQPDDLLEAIGEL